MADNEPRDGPTYLKYKGWYWVEWLGQKSLYHGPYRTQEVAEDMGHKLHREAQMRAAGFHKTKKRGK